MSNKVPQIDSDSESVAPDYPTYELHDGRRIRVAAPSELGLRQIQMLMKTATRVQPALMAMSITDDDEEVSEEEFDTAIEASRAIIRMTSDMTAEDVEALSELECVGYVSGFLEELNSSIGVSQRLRFR